MPDQNTYKYYKRFLKCLEKRYDKESYRKRDAEDDQLIELSARQFSTAFRIVFDTIVEKAPGRCNGGNSWFDEFTIYASQILCPGMWCDKESCPENTLWHPYYCKAGNVPSKCKIWKAWRKQRRSYPEKEECQKCRYYRPYRPDETHEANKHCCYCRAKVLPDNCPKRGNNFSGGNNENG
jgi:hypothetical protein